MKKWWRDSSYLSWDLVNRRKRAWVTAAVRAPAWQFISYILTCLWISRRKMVCFKCWIVWVYWGYSLHMCYNRRLCRSYPFFKSYQVLPLNAHPVYVQFVSCCNQAKGDAVQTSQEIWDSPALALDPSWPFIQRNNFSRNLLLMSVSVGPNLFMAKPQFSWHSKGKSRVARHWQFFARRLKCSNMNHAS